MITHTRKRILAHGYKFTGRSLPEVGFAAIRRAAIDFDVTLDSVAAFRVTSGAWEFYLRPNAVKGFADVAMLPA